jgi:hypothetical protein
MTETSQLVKDILCREMGTSKENSDGSYYVKELNETNPDIFKYLEDNNLIDTRGKKIRRR